MRHRIERKYFLKGIYNDKLNVLNKIVSSMHEGNFNLLD